MREATKFNELGLHRFQGQTEFSQPFGKRFLSTESIRTKLETQHEVADISHHAGLAAKSRLDHSLEPQIEHISIGPEEPASISDSRVATPTGPLPHLNASKIVLVYKLSAGNLQVECKIISAIMSTGCVQRSTGPLQCLQVELQLDSRRTHRSMRRRLMPMSSCSRVVESTNRSRQVLWHQLPETRLMVGRSRSFEPIYPYY
jgi:hypothetical protein